MPDNRAQYRAVSQREVDHLITCYGAGTVIRARAMATNAIIKAKASARNPWSGIPGTRL